MKKRILAALVLLPILLFILYTGSFLLFGFLLAVNIIALNEFLNAMKTYSNKILKYVLMGISVLNLTFTFLGLKSFCLVGVFILFITLAILTLMSKLSLENTLLGVFIFIYISAPIGFVYTMRSEFTVFLPYIFIIAMATDTFAYFVGKFFGKRKLAPTLSPNKTVEGAIGGIVFATLFSLLYALKFSGAFVKFVVPFAIVGSILSQVGDIFASAFKRKMSVKDYGNLIPGHGGIMDRIDSIIFVTMYIFIFLNIFSLIYV